MPLENIEETIGFVLKREADEFQVLGSAFWCNSSNLVVTATHVVADELNNHNQDFENLFVSDKYKCYPIEALSAGISRDSSRPEILESRYTSSHDICRMIVDSPCHKYLKTGVEAKLGEVCHVVALAMDDEDKILKVQQTSNKIIMDQIVEFIKIKTRTQECRSLITRGPTMAIDIQVDSGMSGGAVINDTGDVIGIVSSGATYSALSTISVFPKQVS